MSELLVRVPHRYPASLPLIVARQQIHVMARLVHRRLGCGLSFRSFLRVLAPVVVILAGWVLHRAWLTGAEASRAFGPSFLGSIAFASAVAVACGALTAASSWATQIRAERERLAVLPVGRRSLMLLAATPSLLPTLVGLVFGVTLLVLCGVGMDIAPRQTGTFFVLGLLLVAACHVVWRVLLAPVEGWRHAQKARAALVVASVVVLFVHALWVMSQADLGPGVGPPSPVLWVFAHEAEFSILESLLAMSAAVVVVAAVYAAESIPSRPRAQRGAGLARDWAAIGHLPPAPRVWIGLARIAAKQSSLLTEVAVTLPIVVGLSALVGHLHGIGRGGHAEVVVLIAAIAAALPVLSLGTALGPMGRLLLLGVQPRDVRAGLVLGAFSLGGASVIPGSLVMVARGAPATVLLKFWLAALLSVPVALMVAWLCRVVAATSLGKALVAPLYFTFFYPILQGDVVSNVSALVSVAGVALVCLMVTLRLGLSERTLK